MPEDENRDKHDAERNDPAAPTNTGPITGTGQSSADHKESNSTKQPPHWADRVIAIFTILIFLTYLTSDYFLYKQIGLTRRAIEDSERSFTKTLEQMQSQTTAQTGSMKAMQDAIALDRQFMDEERKANRELADMSRSTAAMSRAGADSFKQMAAETAAAARSQNRPLFSVPAIAIPAKPEPAKEFFANVLAVNYGTMPAIDAKIVGTCFVKQDALDILYARKPFNTLPPPAGEGGTVVEPYIGSFTRQIPCGPITVEDIKGIPSGKFPVTVAGEVYYRESSGSLRHAEFCDAILFGGPVVSICLQHTNPYAP